MGAVVKIRRGYVSRHPGAPWMMFPTGHRCGSTCWLYVVAIPDGRIKVGYTGKPRDRIRVYGRVHDGMPWAHLFSPVKTAKHAVAIEKRAVAYLSAIGEQVGRSEYFTGINKADAIAAVRRAYLETA